MSEQLDLDAIKAHAIAALVGPVNGVTMTLESYRQCRAAVANVHPLCDEIERLRGVLAKIAALGNVQTTASRDDLADAVVDMFLLAVKEEIK